MVIVLVILAILVVSAGGLYAYKWIQQLKLERMIKHEYDVAVTIWKYARLVKSQTDEALKRGGGVIDFQKIAVPHSRGYKVSLELAATGFKIYAVPDRHNKTGRLSFYTDQTLTVRASDRGGARATVDDVEYPGVGG